MSLNTNIPKNYDYTSEIVKSLENLKNNKSEIVEDIEKAEQYKEKLQEKLRSLEIEINELDNSLEEKKIIFNVYDKIIKDSDEAYVTIVKSTEALYQMVKSEEKKVETKRKN